MGTENKVSPIRKLKSMYPLRAKVDESYQKGTEAGPEAVAELLVKGPGSVHLDGVHGGPSGCPMNR